LRLRLPLLLLLGALLLTAVFLLLESGAEQAAESLEEPGGASARPAAAAGAALDEPDDAAELTRTKIRAAEAAAGTAAGSAAAAGPPVDLVVQLLADSAAGRAAPQGCAGWVVVAQSWVRETREIVHHEARADRNGVARFTFPGFVHVDWIACQPPVASGLGYSIHEPHEDVDGGNTVEMGLLLQPGHPITGRVLDLRDQPVAGARVHLYQPSWTYGLDDWTPGFLQAESGADGRFAFPTLSVGEWVVEVEPGAWLQVAPPLGEAIPGRSMAEISAGLPPPEELTLQVTAANRTEVMVWDAGGRPAKGITVWAEPMQLEDMSDLSASDAGQSQGFSRAGSAWFASGRVIRFSWSNAKVTFGGNTRPSYVEDAETAEDPADAPGAESAPAEQVPEQSGPAWEYELLTATTDAQGRAVLNLPAGLWRISVNLGAADGLIDPPAPLEHAVPGPPAEFHLPVRLHPFRGRIVDVRSAPVAGANASFQCEENGGLLEATTDANGEFVLPEAPGVGHWTMTVRSPGSWLATTTWNVDFGSAESRTYLVPDAGRLHVELRDLADLPSQQQNAYLKILPSGLRAPPSVPNALPGRPVPDMGGAELRIGDCRALLDDLAPGDYLVELWANLWDGTWNEWGSPIYGERMLASWAVHTRPEPWLLPWMEIPANPSADDYVNLTGVIEDAASGQPLEGVQVIARSAEQFLAHGTTDVTGRYHMMVRPGACEVWAHRPGWVPAGVAAGAYGAGHHELSLRLNAGGGTLSLLVLDREGRRLQDFELRLLDGAGRPLLAESNAGSRHFGSMSDAVWCSGQPIELRDVPPGMLTLEARFSDAMRATASTAVAPGPNGLVKVRLDRTLEEILNAMDAEPKRPPLEGAVIDLDGVILEDFFRR
jgi:hypothetical protein